MREAVNRSSKRRRTRPLSSASSAPSLANAFFFAIYNEAGYAFINDFGNRTVAEGKNRGAACHRLDHDQTERLRPVDGKQQGARLTQKAGLATLIDLADELNAWFRQHRLYLSLEVLHVHAIYLRRNLQRKADSARNADRAIYCFSRGISAR